MAIEVTLALPADLVENARRFGIATRRDVPTVLADALQMMWPTVNAASDVFDDRPVESLSDNEVLSLSELKLTRSQQKRLGQLQRKGKEFGLTVKERQELLELMQIYEAGMLRKAEALAVAVERGLRKPRYS